MTVAFLSSAGCEHDDTVWFCWWGGLGGIFALVVFWHGMVFDMVMECTIGYGLDFFGWILIIRTLCWYVKWSCCTYGPSPVDSRMKNE